MTTSKRHSLSVPLPLKLVGFALKFSGLTFWICSWIAFGYGTTTGSVPARIISLPLFIASFSLIILGPVLEPQLKKVERRALAKKYAPQVAVWEAQLLNVDQQPNIDDLREIEFKELTEYYPDHPGIDTLLELRLGIYQDTREYGARWIGFRPGVDHDFTCWWLAENPFVPGEWRMANRTFFNTASDEQIQPGDTVESFFSSLLAISREAFEAQLNLIRAGTGNRSRAWLLRFLQTFHGSYPEIIRYMPEEVEVAWDDIHRILHDREAWNADNDMEDMPLDLLLRMHGLGAVVDRIDVASEMTGHIKS